MRVACGNINTNTHTVNIPAVPFPGAFARRHSRFHRAAGAATIPAKIYCLHLNVRRSSGSGAHSWGKCWSGWLLDDDGTGDDDDDDEVNVLYERNIYSVFAFGCIYDILGACVRVCLEV